METSTLMEAGLAFVPDRVMTMFSPDWLLSDPIFHISIALSSKLTSQFLQTRD